MKYIHHLEMTAIVFTLFACNWKSADEYAEMSTDTDSCTGDACAALDSDSQGVDETEPATDTEPSVCPLAFRLYCGDVVHHSMAANGRANEWNGYSCTQRFESGREAFYVFVPDDNCKVEARLTDISTDLDLFLLSDCTKPNADECSSTPLDLQTDETIAFTATVDVPKFLVVDGYNEAEGTYTLELTCTCN